jgi:hypothetical protein
MMIPMEITRMKTDNRIALVIRMAHMNTVKKRMVTLTGLSTAAVRLATRMGR